uniref:Insulin gene enhancer protein ISL-1 n=1 Tax=Denticeps clupeoides TaxID=299321 RepID=A0AAY4EC27_9TELE
MMATRQWWSGGVPSLCAGCGRRIEDRVIVRVSPDLRWHAACLRCAECARPLHRHRSCFFRDGRALCREDYSRLYGMRCGTCRARLESDDFVIRTRAGVYHVACFRCEACGRRLTAGDKFVLRRGSVLCSEVAGSNPEPPGHFMVPSCLTEDTKNVPWSHERIPKAVQRATRVRTVLSKKQLHMLQTCYNANPRPDALVKEQLVEMTGLSSRVIRVWFQNKRCKDKKKNVLQQKDSSSRSLTEEPLMASPGTRGSDGLLSPKHFQSHQQSWNILTELTLQKDRGSDSFHSLVTLLCCKQHVQKDQKRKCVTCFICSAAVFLRR